MSRIKDIVPAQLGFDALLSTGDTQNEARRQEREHAHLPGIMEEALPFLRTLIERHHAAMLAGNTQAVRSARNEAHALAFKLNNYKPGILATEDSPGCVLGRLTRAPDGVLPLWGQEGSFILECRATRVRIEMEGLFGIGAGSMAWLGFSAHAVDRDRPFLSQTGYRSFLGVGGGLASGHTPESFCGAIVEAYVARELKGRLREIASQYR
ncbi:MAG: hypothetical protein B7Y08_06465 [Rhodospirillales bacterium 24-66-33]|jgi:hypothetical protein|uniref:hypothetical protein n=1 Tax=Reyranella sp. TaxID=1929291 RepID=UPI000BC6DB63|nr:hypothetical protein [Reyranella sp.]OYY41093.1 MAG: hypothetical protein B7Y57_16205 [Rhodospirillales bacterium 35-66-84]OYZ96063.1 MAG: hypothetical protein B7Y08_06465 [Rhodospirillales bacterium 24-66-33]OZB21224.1 MAG: hypothetical protein B7X63_28060 [Rhodospirillales bacterium 39-66-50]HQS14881.1 hypothetical protein [Reyranella sp.]HQT14268.1 hypothetical protein [Reyranella sp.]